MNCVNWYQAFAFCIWDGGRLPTEAEWEYAAAGGVENRLYPWAERAVDLTRANYAESAHSERMTVGSYPLGTGAFGHQDLAGSLLEWVFDWYSSSFYEGAGNPCLNCANATTVSESDSKRVVRGGAWNGPASALRSAYRYYMAPGESAYHIGFRCARSP